jgi:hypothetical protein
MSSALARARNRRSTPTENNPPTNNPPSPTAQQPPGRIQQQPNTLNGIFNTIKIRLDDLENNQNAIDGNSSFSEELVTEYEARFETILSEITEMKDLIMKLQSFTMEVNKALYDDRIKILSEDNSINNEIIVEDAIYSDNSESNVEDIGYSGNTTSKK